MVKLPYMCKINSKEKREVTSFCDDVNIYGDSLDEELKNKTCDFIIQTITGLNILDVNLGVYNQLRDYIKENFGKISFSYFDDYIREITVGNFSCGPVLSGNFSNKEIRDRSNIDKVCYGVIPTLNNKDRLFINWNSCFGLFFCCFQFCSKYGYFILFNAAVCCRDFVFNGL